MPALDVVASLAVLTSTFVVVFLVLGTVEERIRAAVWTRMGAAGRAPSRAATVAPPAVEPTATARVA